MYRVRFIEEPWIMEVLNNRVKKELIYYQKILPTRMLTKNGTFLLNSRRFRIYLFHMFCIFNKEGPPFCTLQIYVFLFFFFTLMWLDKGDQNFAATLAACCACAAK